jgi:hypothetical protein
MFTNTYYFSERKVKMNTQELAKKIDEFFTLNKIPGYVKTESDYKGTIAVFAYKGVPLRFEFVQNSAGFSARALFKSIDFIKDGRFGQAPEIIPRRSKYLNKIFTGVLKVLLDPSTSKYVDACEPRYDLERIQNELKINICNYIKDKLPVEISRNLSETYLGKALSVKLAKSFPCNVEFPLLIYLINEDDNNNIETLKNYPIENVDDNPHFGITLRNLSLKQLEYLIKKIQEMPFITADVIKNGKE